MPKVVGVDNFGRDYTGGRDEILVAEGLTPEEAKALCVEKNKDVDDYSLTHYVVRPDNYVLYIFEGY